MSTPVPPAAQATIPTPAAAMPAGVEALHQAWQRQHDAARAEPTPTLACRRDRLRRLKALLDTDGPALIEAVRADFGQRSAEEIRLTELVVLQAELRHAMGRLRRWMRPRGVSTAPAYWPGRARLMPQPLGVVGIISPWNYPLQLALAPLVGVLAAGNRALIKPSELTPHFSAALALAVARHFAPDEVTVIEGDVALGQAFTALALDHLVFTGSTPVGRLVAQAAARQLTPVTLELGGKSPALIDPSCPMDATLDRLAWGKLINAGQTCIAPDHVLIGRAQVEPFVQTLQQSMRRLYPRFVGNPDYTAIISERHLQRLQALVEDARQRGARVIELEPAPPTGSTRQMPPVLLLDVDDSMLVMQEEIFGPILPIVVVADMQQAIARVQRMERPLALYWFGQDAQARRQVLEQTVSGGVTINDTLLHIAQHGLPFGGVGPSGMGHYHGEHGFRQFSKDKPVFIQSRWSAGGLIRPPYRPWLARLLDWLERLA